MNAKTRKTLTAHLNTLKKGDLLDSFPEGEGPAKRASKPVVIEAILADDVIVDSFLKELDITDEPTAPRKSRGIALEPKDSAVACRAGSKQAILVDCLHAGATMDELMSALSQTGKAWTEASVKSGFNWDVHSVKGYGVRTEQSEDGEPSATTYHLVLPKGLSAPVEHSVPKATKKEVAEEAE